MSTKKPVRKRASTRKTKFNVDPTRLALAALERVKTVLTRTGKLDRFAEGATPREMQAREALLGRALPPSYDATMRVSATFGGPEKVLDAAGMKSAHEMLVREGADWERYVPFCLYSVAGARRTICFDREIEETGGELGVIEWTQNGVRFLAPHFGDWLDLVADSREEEIERSASIPMGLRKLLVQLGFSFDDPIVGRLETGDVAAIQELVGAATARDIRGHVDRLFDSSGKASLTLNLDEFTVAVSLRTGIFLFEAEDVFRWLRSFRDENFFGDSVKHPTHPDQVRDLRKAPREPPLIQRGITQVAVQPARKYTFRSASGKSADDFFLLGRTHSIADAGKAASSLVVHVVKGEVKDVHAVPEPLNDLYVTTDGTLWGLSHAGTAVRFAGGTARSFPLERPTRGRAWWYGIGAGGDRVLVWGAGALLEFDGGRFEPFLPDAGLLGEVNVIALWASKREVAMLVCGDHFGAVARFDGKQWIPIGEDHVIDTTLADLDVWRGIAIVLARDGRVWRIEGAGAPRPVKWDRGQEAFLVEGVPRNCHAVRGFDGGAMVASDGGVIIVGSGDPVFYDAGNTTEPARIARVGASTRREGPPGPRGQESSNESALVAMCGPNARMWMNGGFSVIDLTSL
jgi:hypothetical protein